jgi:hypothetical protein
MIDSIQHLREAGIPSLLFSASLTDRIFFTGHA